MRKLVIVGLLASIGLQAQTAVRKFEWRMDLVSDIPTLQSYTYRYYLDGSGTGTIMTSVVCTATAGPWTCTAPVPTTIKGSHTVTITVALTPTSVTSQKSNQTTITDVIIPPTAPAPPTGFRIVPQ